MLRIAEFCSFLDRVGVVQLAEIDGPFVTLRLSGRFWHTRSMVLARVANYLQKRIPVSFFYTHNYLFCIGHILELHQLLVLAPQLFR